MYCQTCEGDSHFCADLHLHYANFSQTNLPLVVGGVSPYMGNEVQEFQQLCLQSYVKLITNSRSLTKAVRSLARYNFMRDTIEAMATNPSTTMMAKSVVMMASLRSFVPITKCIVPNC